MVIFFPPSAHVRCRSDVSATLRLPGDAVKERLGAKDGMAATDLYLSARAQQVTCCGCAIAKELCLFRIPREDLRFGSIHANDGYRLTIDSPHGP